MIQKRTGKKQSAETIQKRILKTKETWKLRKFKNGLTLNQHIRGYLNRVIQYHILS